jgi:two-component system invasion response regulator UvrY
MIRIFLVDDHQIVREGLRALLQVWGYEVVGETADLAEALVEIQRLEPDILLLDLHLEGRSGLELLADLNRRDFAVRCIVLTMVAQPRMVAEALGMGAMGYVLKGSAGRELAEAIEAVAQGKRYLGVEVAQLAAQSFMQADAADPLAVLSAREKQVVALVVKGMTSAEIGSQLHLSPKTIATYRCRLMAKLSVADVPALVRLAIRHNLIDEEHT